MSPGPRPARTRAGEHAVAIIVGQQLGARLPQRVINLTAAASFVVFGLLLVAKGIG